MPRSNQTGEFNTFVGGLITEASPLTFPENASIDEANFILNRDGSRERRPGFDYEAGLVPFPISYVKSPIGDVVVSVFEWNNVGGVAGKTFIACQVHDKVYLIDRTDEALKASSGVKDSLPLDTTSVVPRKASFSSIDGKLIVAYGNSTIKVVSYDSDLDTFSTEDKMLKIRDLFGVADPFTFDEGGPSEEVRDLLSPEYINYRPDTTDDLPNHMYNLRNQGWAAPRLRWDDFGVPSRKTDPIEEFRTEVMSGLPDADRGLPSNADSVASYLYPNTSLDHAVTDKTSERFDNYSAGNQEPPKARAAFGHYIIDLLDRGQSRQVEYGRGCNPDTGLYTNANPRMTPTSVEFETPTVALPTDRTGGGINVAAEFAGRVWYGGFSSEVVDGDNQSPNLASYLFYSQQVQHDSQIGHCYQEGDPTSAEAPDILDTDGGFIRLSGAYNIQAMVNVGSGLLVFAENGIWLVGGSDNGTFNANNQSVSKVTEHGTISVASIVLVDGTLMYWSEDAIYHLKTNQTGGYVAEEVSVNIRTLYQSISDRAKALCQGIYDPSSKKVRWVYNNIDNGERTTELVFDIVLGAFYLAIIENNLGVSKIPTAPVQVSPYSLTVVGLNVLAGTNDVVVGTDDVVTDAELLSGGYRSTSYLTLVNSEDVDNTSITFSNYNNVSFKDWGTEDAPAHMLTGYIGTGDNARYKQVPYIYFHLLRTEDGFTDNGDDFIVNNESSCRVQAQWDWTNSPSYGKWGKEFQAYRYKRRYTPEDETDTYDYGTSTIVTKNKLRGRGRVVSLLINSEPEKDMKLLGWSMNISSNTNA